jgi:hypothetical protein
MLRQGREPTLSILQKESYQGWEEESIAKGRGSVLVYLRL